MENVLFEFFRGDTYQRNFAIKGWNRKIDNVYFTVKENADNKKYCLQKTLGNGITVVDETEDSTTFNLFICCTDTDTLKANTNYVFDIEIHSKSESGEVIKRTAITGTLRLKASPTKTCNER